MSTDEIPPLWAAPMVAAGAIDPRRKTVVPSINRLASMANLSPETVRRMIRGIGASDPDSVNAVADVLGEDRVIVSGWVRQARSVQEDWQPTSDSALLDEDERRTLDRLISLMVAERRRSAVGELRRAITSVRAELQRIKHDLDEGAPDDQTLRLADALVDAHLRTMDRALDAAEERSAREVEAQTQDVFSLSLEIHAQISRLQRRTSDRQSDHDLAASEGVVQPSATVGDQASAGEENQDPDVGR